MQLEIAGLLLSHQIRGCQKEVLGM